MIVRALLLEPDLLVLDIYQLVVTPAVQHGQKYQQRDLLIHRLEKDILRV